MQLCKDDKQVCVDNQVNHILHELRAVREARLNNLHAFMPVNCHCEVPFIVKGSSEKNAPDR